MGNFFFLASFIPLSYQNRSLAPFDPRFSMETNFKPILFYVSISIRAGAPRVNLVSRFRAAYSINIKFKQKEIHLSVIKIENKKIKTIE